MKTEKKFVMMQVPESMVVRFYALIKAADSDKNTCLHCGSEELCFRATFCKKCSSLENGRSKRGVAMTSQKTKKLTRDHWRASEGLLRDASGIIHYFRNIRLFVSENAHLFDPKDLQIMRSGNSNASAQLSRVHSGGRGTWKGWTLVSDVEIKEGGWDLLRRKQRAVPESNGTAQKIEVE